MENLVDPSSLVLSLIMIGFITETVIELMKRYVQGYKHADDIIDASSIILSVILCFVLRISIFDETSMMANYIGTIIAGFVASRGSNYIHNWFDTLPKKIRKS